jgi:hypothetical protein
MAYVRYKEVTKRFCFYKAIDKNNLPDYVKEYVFDEKILAAYIVGRDHGIITDKKIILFDNTSLFSIKKEITIIPFHSISSHSVVFRLNFANLYMLLDSGYPLMLKFTNLKARDKVRIRLLYSAISAVVCNQKIPDDIMKRLINEDFDFKDRKES